MSSVATEAIKSTFNNLSLSLKQAAKRQQVAGAAQVLQATVQKAALKQPPSYYQKLERYFPRHEMKDLSHFEALLEDKPHIYRKDESQDHVLMFSDHKDFMCVDYVWVNSESRGKGIGKQLIRNMQSEKKPILLEVEEVSEDDMDTLKRLKFYKREGFRHAHQIRYVRKAALTGEENSMEILFWCPEEKEYTQDQILQHMRRFYSEVHTHRAEEFYGKRLEPPTTVLQMSEAPKQDILEQL